MPVPYELFGHTLPFKLLCVPNLQVLFSNMHYFYFPSWCKVQEVLHCQECFKPRCVYSARNLSQIESMLLDVVVEDKTYTRGAAVIPPNSPLADTVVVRQNIRCQWNCTVTVSYLFHFHLFVTTVVLGAGCCHVSKTSTTAQLNNCTYATNAGYFNALTGCCVGNLITNSSIVEVRVCVCVSVSVKRGRERERFRYHPAACNCQS